MLRTSVTVLALAVAAGCSSASKVEKRPSGRPEQPITRAAAVDVGTAYKDGHLRGAAYSAAGYRHVIEVESPDYRMASRKRRQVNAGTAASSTADGSTDDGDVTSKSGSSDGTDASETRMSETDSAIRQASAPSTGAQQTGAARARMLWRKYCNAGVDMAQREFRALRQLRRDHPMPAALRDECSPPK